MVVPLEKFEVAMEKPVPFTLVVRGDEKLANFIELHDVDIGSFGGVVTAILSSPQGGTIILPWQADQTGQKGIDNPMSVPGLRDRLVRPDPHHQSLAHRRRIRSGCRHS